MMLRSPGLRRPVRRVSASDVVVDDDPVGLGVRLAREHVAALELIGFERVVLAHLHAALDDARAAGPHTPPRTRTARRGARGAPR